MMQRWLWLVAAMIATPTMASPPPRPPEYVYDAGLILASSGAHDPAMVAALFANNVTVVENGEPAANGKTAWLKWRAADERIHPSRVIAYSESSAGYRHGDGELLVIDTFDTVDRTHLPPNSIVDPWMATRSILYVFGRDRLIHRVMIQQTGGFLMSAKS